MAVEAARARGEKNKRKSDLEGKALAAHNDQGKKGRFLVQDRGLGFTC